jgi:hypothetical protein
MNNYKRKNKKKIKLFVSISFIESSISVLYAFLRADKLFWALKIEIKIFISTK